MSQVRSPVVAGTFYPGATRQLSQQIEGFLTHVEPIESKGEVMGLISPHAGYLYSGQTAAHAYAQVRGASFDAVVVMSPLHRLPLGRFAVTRASAYQTPLGSVPLDEKLVSALQRELDVERVSFDGEHAIEVQIPFLQVVLQDTKLLPIMIGDPSFAAGQELGRAGRGHRPGKSFGITAQHHADSHLSDDPPKGRNHGCHDAKPCFA